MTDEPIFRLIYGSENRLRGSAAELDAGIGTIMASSTRNNGTAGITGALLFTGSHFTQVLEGPRSKVERTFERISQDFRHGEVVLIDLQEARERAFASWSMTLLDTRAWPSPAANEVAGLAALAADDAPGQPIVELLKRFLARRAEPHPASA